MAYTGDSPLLGKGQASAAAIQDWIEINAERVMGRNHITNWDVPDNLGTLYVEFGKLTGLNHDLMVSQAAKETAFFTSRIFRDKLNPAGIGAINAAPYEGAITFTNVFDGVRAQYGHMLSYVKGEDHKLIDYSFRHKILRDLGYLGIVKVLKDLNQRWAWSPEDVYESTPDHLRYGQSVAIWAQGMLDYAKEHEENPVAEIPLPYHKDIDKHVEEDSPFATFWRQLAADVGFTRALMIIGYPITDPFTVDGVTMQYFERARLEHHPGVYPEHHDVLLGHLGREDVRLQDETRERLELIAKIEKLLGELRGNE